MPGGGEHSIPMTSELGTAFVAAGPPIWFAPPGRLQGDLQHPSTFTDEGCEEAVQHAPVFPITARARVENFEAAHSDPKPLLATRNTEHAQGAAFGRSELKAMKLQKGANTMHTYPKRLILFC